jgi:hypothetical protein
MAIRPSSFAAAESAVRDPRGGSLDPAVVVDDSGATRFSSGNSPSNWVLGSSAAMRRIAKSIERAAEVECTVLVCGETGTGKELWARLLHRSGPRRSRAFIPVNCAALTPSLAESQLFGHEKGAFTGANGRALGIFRAAERDRATATTPRRYNALGDEFTLHRVIDAFVPLQGFAQTPVAGGATKSGQHRHEPVFLHSRSHSAFLVGLGDLGLAA